jgi:preprotein translocase subunit SecF
MASKLSTWGNALYTGEKVYPIVQRRKRWLTISTILVIASLAILGFKGINPSIDFRGGTEYTVSAVVNPTTDIAIAVIEESFPGEEPRVTLVGSDSVRIQMGEIPQEDVQRLAEQLAEAYGVSPDDVTSTFIGPTWGQDISQKAIQGLVIFLLVVSLVIGVYFRAWRMAAAAIVALLHDLIFTAGIYALVGFEVSPATVIGFLTILGYSLYDTVVVFDKVRENTEHLETQTRYTYEELANLAVNQTLVRSINTSVVALLPVASILFIGSFLLGAGTLKDISLALFVGMAVGTFSSIFVATPLDVALRSREPRIRDHTAKVLVLRASGAVPTTVDEKGIVRVGALTPGGHQGTAAQPKRKRRK